MDGVWKTAFSVRWCKGVAQPSQRVSHCPCPHHVFKLAELAAVFRPILFLPGTNVPYPRVSLLWPKQLLPPHRLILSHLITMPAASRACPSLPEEVWMLILSRVPLSQRLGSCARVSSKLFRAATAATTEVVLPAPRHNTWADSLQLYLCRHG